MKNIINIALALSILYSGNLFELGVLEYNNRAIGSIGLVASNIYIDKAINLFEENLQNHNENIEQTVIYLHSVKSNY